MGVSVNYYYGIAERLKDFLTNEEYQAWNYDNMDENHIVHRLTKNGYDISSSEEEGHLWLFG